MIRCFYHKVETVLAVFYIWKWLCMFRVVPSPTITSAYNYIYSIWYLSYRYCYLPLLWTSCKFQLFHDSDR